MQIDLTNFKNDTARRNFLREDSTKDLLEFLQSKYGEDFVRQVGTNEIAVERGDVINNEGFKVAATMVYSVSVKNWNSVLRKDGKETEPYSMFDEAENYKEMKGRKEK